MKRLMSLAAFSAALMCGTAQAQQSHRQDRRDERHVEPLRRHRRARLDRGCEDGDRRFRQEPIRTSRSKCVSADHQNKPDVGSQRRQPWIDVEKVDMIVDVPNSGVALAVSQIVAGKNKVFIVSGAAASDLTGRQVQRQHHPLDLRHLDAGQRHRQRDGEDRRRHLVLPHRRLCVRSCARARHRRGRREERRQGGRARCVIRSTRTDFSSFLLQAQSSKAKIIGLANAGGDTINSIKQAAEFGIVKGGQKLAGLAGVRERRQRARTADRAGPDADRNLVLGPQRRQPRMDQALAGRARRSGQVSRP